MINHPLKVMANRVMTLLVIVVCSVAAVAQNANSASQMSLEEKLVRDAYLRLMRYHSAGLDDTKERDGKTVGPQDYLTFELQNIHSGPISELENRSFAEIVTARGGDVLNVRPAYLNQNNDPAFAFYEAEWTTVPEADPPAPKPSFASFNRYTSYLVKVRLKGKVRQYRALAVYQLNPDDPQAARPKTFQILDNVTGEMNTVYADVSPRVRIPWSQYVKTSAYRAVVKKIKDLQAAGQPLLPSNLPAGELIGDDPGDPPPPPDPEPTACAAPRITGPTNVWWFNGENPAGYATSITLTASPATGSSYVWTVVEGAAKVTLSNQAGNTIRVTGRNASTFREVGIRVAVDGINSPVFRLSVRAPHRLVLTQNFVHAAHATMGYSTEIHYRIEDQFTDVLPSTVPLNEQFTTGLISDFPGNNWQRGPEGGANVSPADWLDFITGQPAGSTPPSRNPCSPLCNTRVHHFDGGWFIGSTTIGSGRRVQTNTWQRFTDHAEHTNRVSPVP